MKSNEFKPVYGECPHCGESIAVLTPVSRCGICRNNVVTWNNEVITPAEYEKRLHQFNHPPTPAILPLNRLRDVAQGAIGWGTAAAVGGIGLGLIVFIAGLVTADVSGLPRAIVASIAAAITYVIAGLLLKCAFHWGAEMLLSSGRKEELLAQQIKLRHDDNE